MTQALATTQPQQKQKASALAVMASKLSVEPAKLLSTLKSTVFQKASDDELLALVVVANEYNLNPFLKELYAFPAKGGGIVPIVSVDGWNKMLIRQPDFDGIEFAFEDDSEGNVRSCTATIHCKSRRYPVKITEYLDECKRNTDPWNTMPRRMLRNRTLCQASRVAFGFSGVYHEDEAAAITVESTVVSAPKAPDFTPKAIAAPKEASDEGDLGPSSPASEPESPQTPKGSGGELPPLQALLEAAKKADVQPEQIVKFAQTRGYTKAEKLEDFGGSLLMRLRKPFDAGSKSVEEMKGM